MSRCREAVECRAVRFLVEVLEVSAVQRRPPTYRELARLAGVTPGTIGLRLHELRRRGWLETSAPGHRTNRTLVPTLEGLRVARQHLAMPASGVLLQPARCSCGAVTFAPSSPCVHERNAPSPAQVA